MHSFFSLKSVRFLLSVGVSIWMAGGCLFGCSGTAMGAESEHDVQTAVAGESCHSARSHDCCSQNAKQPETPKKNIAKQQTNVPSFAPAPRGMMNDCPLVANATAATPKSSGQLPEPGRGLVSALPIIENKIEQSNISHVVAYLPNRGPTHLRCCVFLI